MVTKTYLIPLFLSGALTASAALASEPDPRYDMARDWSMHSVQMESTPIYGQEIVTSWEIKRHKDTLRSMQTEQERNAFLEEHRQRMQDRAEGMGVELAEEDESPYMGWRSQTAADAQTLKRHNETNHTGP